MTDEEGGLSTSLPISDAQTRQILWAVVFALLFMIAGTLAPALYYQNERTDAFFTVDSYVAHDAPENASALVVSMSRTARSSYSAEVHVELIRLEDDYAVRVASWERLVLYEAGTKDYRLTYPVENKTLSPGTYRLAVVIRLELPHDTTRTVEFESNKFVVYPGNATGTPPYPFAGAPDAPEQTLNSHG